MLYNLKEHHYPTTVEEAINLSKNPRSNFLAGGTNLTLISNSFLESLIDLQNLNLSYIRKKENNIVIGSMTSAYEIAFNKSLPKSLRDCARWIGDIPLLHGVTIGGNIAEFLPWNDIPPLLWVLDPKVKYYDPDSEQIREITVEEFFITALEKNFATRRALILEIIFPISPSNCFSHFQKFTLSKIDKSQMNLASYFEWDSSGKFTKARLAVSAITKSPSRLREIEKLLLNKKLTPELESICIEKLESEITPIPNFKSSKEYRLEIAKVYLKRTLHACQQQITQNS